MTLEEQIAELLATTTKMVEIMASKVDSLERKIEAQDVVIRELKDKINPGG